MEGLARRLNLTAAQVRKWFYFERLRTQKRTVNEALIMLTRDHDYTSFDENFHFIEDEGEGIIIKNYFWKIWLFFFISLISDKTGIVLESIVSPNETIDKQDVALEEKKAKNNNGSVYEWLKQLR